MQYKIVLAYQGIGAFSYFPWFGEPLALSDLESQNLVTFLGYFKESQEF